MKVRHPVKARIEVPTQGQVSQSLSDEILNFRQNRLPTFPFVRQMGRNDSQMSTQFDCKTSARSPNSFRLSVPSLVCGDCWASQSLLK